MAEIVVPQLGESVTEAIVAKWYKKEGEAVKKDEVLVELETDKVTLEVNAEADGALVKISAGEGSEVEVGAILGTLEEGAEGTPSNDNQTKAEAKPAAAAPQQAPAAAPASGGSIDKSGPAARKLVAENNVNPSAISGSGKDGRITKGDVLEALDGGLAEAPAAGPREERVKMTKLRQTIARRLKESQNTAAMLTTFNEIDMGSLMALRSQYKDKFEETHGIKLGFMGFFTKAVIAALKEIPAVNAEIAGDEIIYKNYYHIGIAVGSPQGLVVPVVRDANQLSLAGVEGAIADYGKKARNGQLGMSDLQGGTFTISNGGVFGSMLSTPIINPPQSGILGLHKIEDRPVVINGEIKVRPMMYVALTYDHRIIDGREAVTFLVRVKENIEDPQRLLLGV